MINREWWRFGYQKDTWFVQRLIPTATNFAKLVPNGTSVCGASLRQLWVVSDDTLSIATKDVARGSNPDTYGELDRSLMFAALSLGVPRLASGLEITSAPIKWDGLEFNTIIGSKRDQKGEVLATAPFKGQLKLGDN